MDANGSDRSTSATGLGKLLPRALAEKRRRKKKQQLGSDASSEDLGVRGRSPASSRYTNESDLNEDTSNHSFSIAEEDRLPPHQPDASLAAVETDEDSLSARPTVVSTHPSQIGYLTTSSPLVQEEHLKGTQEPPEPSSTENLSRSSTLPVTDSIERTDSLDSATSSPLRHSKTGLAIPRNAGARRSPSPVGRFRKALRSRSSNRQSTGSISPERIPTVAAASTSNDSLDSKNIDKPGLESASNPSLSSKPDTAKEASTQRFRRLSKGQTIETAHPPRTPPNGATSAPVIVNTPPTPTDHSRPHDLLSHTPTKKATSNAAPKPVEPVPTLAHRRGRSGSGSAGPSKLSNITAAPLTPTPENAQSPLPTGNFFSSMISVAQNVAQNAANTWTNTIANNNSTSSVGNNGGNGGQSREKSSSGDTRVEVESYSHSQRQLMDSQEPAVKTLGRGDLSLSQLGINDPPSNATSPITSRFVDSMSSRVRADSAPVEANNGQNDSQPSSQARSVAEPGSAERTPAGSIYEDATGLQRNGSVRSSLRRHRKRGSSTMSGQIGAPITATHTALTQNGGLSNNSTTKLTGFAVASAKRNRDFHQLFKSVPDDDLLIDDFSCALQLQILAHGRLYVSEGHLCFNSNIFGYVTTLVMSFDEILSVEKRSTALLFKNGLLISTINAKHVFASFASRDSTYQLIVKVWGIRHPSLQSSLNGVRLDETGGDKTEKVDVEEVRSLSLAGTQSGSELEDSEDDEEDVYDEDAEDEMNESVVAQPIENGTAEAALDKVTSRKTSAALPAAEKPKEAAGGTAPGTGAQDFPGPATHGKTDCGDADTHYDKQLSTDVIPAPLGKVYDIMFGPTSCQYMSKWLTDDQKCFDLQMEDKKGLTAENKTRTYSYTKPLNASLGPKQTKCIVTEKLDAMDLEKAISITCSTQTPDVPSGNVFTVKTRYCLTWDEKNQTKINVNCTIEWSGKSWIKGPIENGVVTGQQQYCKDLFASLKSSVSSRPRAGTGNGVAAKGKKKGRKGRTGPTSGPASDAEGGARAQAAKQDWGLLEPVRGIVSPVLDTVKPLITGNLVYGLLVGLLVASWFGFGFSPSGRTASRHPYGADLAYLSYPDRVAAYEEMWRREESELWQWLEERVGMERLSGAQSSAPSTPPPRKNVADSREVREAIRATEEKLKMLKVSLEKGNN
ncbi:hypothetical protein ACKVWC_004436 [Pyricularia oryzae]